MAFSGEDTVAELTALTAAVRQLVKAANATSIGGAFAKEALKAGLAELADTNAWGVPETMKSSFREDAKRRYEELFRDI